MNDVEMIVRCFLFCCASLFSFGLSAGGVASTGERIYQQGMIDENIPVGARAGTSGTQAEGLAVACANCHGERAEGKPEAWGRPPALNWSYLSRPLGEVRSDGSVRPPYDEKSFVRVITQGMDAGGRPLAADMPRFELRSEEIKFLLAYLRQIDAADNRIARLKRWLLGSFIAPSAPDSARQALVSLEQCIKAHPTLYGHPLIVKVFEFGSGDAESFVKQLVTTTDLLALVAPVIAGSELQLISALSGSGLPVIGPVGMVTPEERASEGDIYFLFGGLREETAILADQLAKEMNKTGRLWVVTSDDALGQQLMLTAKRAVQLVRQDIQVTSWPLEQNAYTTHQGENSLRTDDALLMLTPVATPRGAELLGRLPAGVMIGLPWMFLAGAEQEWADRVSWVSYPWIAGQKGPLSLYGRWGYLSCELMLESLRRAGAQPTRSKLTKALASIDGFGGADDQPNLRFSGERHIGARGAYLAPLNAQYMPAVDKSRWIDLDKP